ncbi:hypothetical protein GCM10022222_01100 [Amycolatopsis ultiminotia]|uniref:AB hydrolase-1 domain-containing protein n=1 Tax=Amycolatopsis ultiminotia TaxID=543629 RepID=A0ABP6UUR5_9PSEU
MEHSVSAAVSDWRGIDWAAHRHDVVIAGRRLTYIDIGEAPETCLLIHGLAASWQWWLETVPALLPHRRVIAVDLPGFGASEPATIHSIDAIVGTLGDLCIHLNLDAVDVVGHSLGTVLGCAFAAHAPRRVRRLVLTGGPILSVLRLFHAPITTLRAHPQVAGFLIEALTAGLPLPATLRGQIANRPWARRLAMAPYFAHPDHLAPDLAARLLDGAGAPAVLPTLRQGFRYTPGTALHGHRHPILLIGGTHDTIAPPADLHEFARHNTVERTVLLDDTGHSPMLEQPAAFNHELTQFLIRPTPAPA